MLDEKIINRSLKRKYGYQEGGQNFRIARTAEQFELRKDFLENKFLLKPKYNYLEGNFWVLEKIWVVAGESAEYIHAKWTYEPIFIYMNPETKEPIPITEDSIEAFIHLCQTGTKRKDKVDWEAKEEAEYERQSTVILDYLQNECPSMAVQLRHGSAIVKPENYGESDNRIDAPALDSGVQAGNVPAVPDNSASANQ